MTKESSLESAYKKGQSGGNASWDILNVSKAKIEILPSDKSYSNKPIPLQIPTALLESKVVKSSIDKEVQ